jgi:hypothetical protein
MYCRCRALKVDRIEYTGVNASPKTPEGLIALSSRPFKQAKQIALDTDDLGLVLVPVLAIVVLCVFVEAQRSLCNVILQDPELVHLENETSGMRARVQGGQRRWIRG